MRIAVLGAGTMGSGIAQLAAMHDRDVALYDISEPALDKALRTIESSLQRFVAKGRFSEQDAADITQRIRPTRELDEAVASVTVVIEAVPEELELKRDVIRRVASAAPEHAWIGTNTSQLSISSIGESIPSDAHRLIGTHFFNPPFLMRLVELVRGEQTADRTVRDARAFAESLGREVVLLKRDAPGFITTRVSAIVRLECLRILEEGVASPEDIDRACRLGLGFPMGPIELGDFNGLDTYLKALESLEDAYGDRFRPTNNLRELVDAGHLGRKSGRGFFEHDADGRRVNPGDTSE